MSTPFLRGVGLGLVLLLFLCSLVSAQEIGTVELVQGSVRLKRTSHSEILKEPGTVKNLFRSDTLQTGPETVVRVELNDKEDEVELRSNSYLELSDIAPATTTVKLLTGKAGFKVSRLGRIEGQRNFRVRTVHAVVGVRGTEFVMGVSGTQTSVLTLDGLVGLASIEAPEVVVDVSPGTASTVQVGYGATPPVPVAPEAQGEILRSESPEVFQATVPFGPPPPLGAPPPSERPQEGAAEPPPGPPPLDDRLLDGVKDAVDRIPAPSSGGGVRFKLEVQ